MKFVCGRCKKPTENFGQYKDFHGNCFAFVCDNCGKEINTLLKKLFAKYGGVEGKCSCRNSPFVHSGEHLQELVN